jgi:excisionase family DNA binding protein
MANRPPPQKSEWITTREAAEILKLPVHSVLRMADAKAFVTRKFPGMHRQLSRESVEKVASESIVPAESTG